MLKKKYDFNIKIVLIGDSEVGKTCILNRYINNVFTPEQVSTKSVEFYGTTLQKDGQHIFVQIWDTVGQEQFRSVTSSYFKGSVGAVLVFDLTSIDSFHNMSYWLNEFKEKGQPNSVIVLVGNKSDLATPNENEENFDNSKIVPSDEINAFAKANSLPYIEASAKTGQNIQTAFETLLDSILTNLSQGVYDVAIPSDFESYQSTEENQDSSCC